MEESPSDIPWFESWFDTQYYHVLYANRDTKEAALFIDGLVSSLALKPGDSVMDLACGKGRHALQLAAHGLEVTGLDLSENSIASLRHLNTDTLHFERWDMRVPYHRRGYDVIFNLFTSFGYFDSMKDNAEVLSAMSHSLRPGGKVVIDYLNTVKALTLLKNDEHIHRAGMEFFTRKQLADGHIVKHIRVLDKGMEHHFNESIQALELEDFEKLFLDTDLSLVKTFGDYHLGAFDISRSPRLIMVLEKKD